jgi:hypothetical protein
MTTLALLRDGARALLELTVISGFVATLIVAAEIVGGA